MPLFWSSKCFKINIHVTACLQKCDKYSTPSKYKLIAKYNFNDQRISVAKTLFDVSVCKQTEVMLYVRVY